MFPKGVFLPSAGVSGNGGSGSNADSELATDLLQRVLRSGWASAFAAVTCRSRVAGSDLWMSSQGTEAPARRACSAKPGGVRKVQAGRKSDLVSFRFVSFCFLV